MTPDRERVLLEEIRSDRSRFAIFFDHYYGRIFGYVYRRVADYDLAHDISAETFLKAFLKVQSFRWNGTPLSAWLYRIATNEVNYFFRKKRYAPYRFQSILDYELLKRDYNQYDEEKTKLEQELKQHNDFIHVQRTLKTLDTKYQEVIALRYFESKEIREIGEILGKPEGTIKSLISRGLEKLRSKMGR